MQQTVIHANENQRQKLLDKHLKPNGLPLLIKQFGAKQFEPVVERKYSYDDEDDIGFVILKLRSGKRCQYQLRSKQTEPCFVSFDGFDNNIRYDISYPDGEMLEILTREAILTRDNFWKGGEI